MTDASGTYGAGTDAILRVVPAPSPSIPPTNPETSTMLIRITTRTKASLDGTHVITLDEGAVTDVSIEVGESLIEQGKAEYVGAEGGHGDPAAVSGDATPAPVPPAPENTTVAHAAAQGEQVAGSTLPAVPPANASRADHDAVATELGLDPSVYANRDEVREAIIARLEGLAAQG